MASADGIVTVRGRKYCVKWRSDGYGTGFRVYTVKSDYAGLVLSADKLVKSEALEAAAIKLFRAELLAWFDENSPAAKKIAVE